MSNKAVVAMPTSSGNVRIARSVSIVPLAHRIHQPGLTQSTLSRDSIPPTSWKHPKSTRNRARPNRRTSSRWIVEDSSSWSSSQTYATPLFFLRPRVFD